MDTSKEYIKMCDCPEIQDEYKAIKGLFVPHGKLKEFYKEFYVLEGIWLPRQDQLQEMISKYNSAYHKIWAFYKFISDENFMIRLDWSMEQLWLAFIMWEKHKKFWDNEKWTTLEDLEKEPDTLQMRIPI